MMRRKLCRLDVSWIGELVLGVKGRQPRERLAYVRTSERCVFLQAVSEVNAKVLIVGSCKDKGQQQKYECMFQ